MNDEAPEYCVQAGYQWLEQYTSILKVLNMKIEEYMPMCEG